ncbi:MAG: MBL fold metallo-hydrolase, partial [Acidimicrobiales bacterium]
MFLGVRGSTPAPGSAFVGVGGNTSCIAVAHDDQPPSLILDAGTGLRRLGQLLGEAPFCGSILLSHLHWDHVQGLPFCPAVDRPDARVALWLPEQGDTVTVLARGLSPPHFPIGPDGLGGDWQFLGMEAGRRGVVEGFDVLALDVPHKGGRTFGYRISDGHRSVAYLPDHATGAGL